jgi:hypothetical protein
MVSGEIWVGFSFKQTALIIYLLSVKGRLAHFRSSDRFVSLYNSLSDDLTSHANRVSLSVDSAIKSISIGFPSMPFPHHRVAGLNRLH